MISRRVAFAFPLLALPTEQAGNANLATDLMQVVVGEVHDTHNHQNAQPEFKS